MTNSDAEPEVIFLDYVHDGRCRLLVRWNITKVEKEDIMTKKSRISWNYSERIIWWILPQKYDTVDEILKYLNTIEFEILNWAMATDVNHDGTVSKNAAKNYVSK